MKFEGMKEKKEPVSGQSNDLAPLVTQSAMTPSMGREEGNLERNSLKDQLVVIQFFPTNFRGTETCYNYIENFLTCPFQ